MDALKGHESDPHGNDDPQGAGDIDRFYEDLPAFDDFANVADPSVFAAIPDDWTVLCADIVRSRAAMAEGHYKTVNMIAASVVAALVNLDPERQVPFVFAGDGAAAAVPPDLVGPARRALATLRLLARDTAGLELRAAAIPLADLRAAGGDLRVAKFRLSPANTLAMFAGGGIALADTILKDPARVGPYDIAPEAGAAASLDGLSCRWEAMRARNGHIATLLLRPGSEAGSLSRILAELGRLPGLDVAGRTPASAPVRREGLRFRFPPSGLMREARIVGWRRGVVRALGRALFESVAFLVAVKSGRRVGPLEPDAYLDDLVRNTDYRKFDDTLRLVLDVDADQLAALRAYLDDGVRAGRLSYGLHVSDSALMTCLVTSLEDDRHIHFVDGADGGYARAAEDLERRQAA
ncbi:DUF3095 domain-containing protein [Stappia sp.]|uniref:DUF3095 domain-containing protein n=1 Tax=Stappia sp. TaxID=1870903 RepID=UPI0032D98428